MAVVDVVKYEGGPDVFAWKFPGENLGTWTQLIVGESQEAVLFKSGKALDIFGSGRHELSTDNIPLLGGLVSLPFKKRSPFSAEVWYVNKVHSLDVKWGTATPIQIQDPRFGILVPLRAYGQFGVKIDEAKKFLVKLVGALPVFDTARMTAFFRGLYLTKVKDAISTYLVHRKTGILEINAYLEEISAFMGEKLKPVLADYGIGLLNFFVNDISAPEDDPAILTLKDALAKRAEMSIIGYSYREERSFDTLEGAAKNPGASSSGLLNAGIGLGVGTALGGAMGGELRSMAGNITTRTAQCPRCGAPLPEGVKFCSECGAPRSRVCGKCGAALAADAKFCSNCGEKA